MMVEMTLFLASVLILSALHKLMQPARMAQALTKLSGVPSGLASSALLGLASVEFLTGLALVFPQSRMVGAIIAAMIWSTYGAALGRKFGTSLDCGCDFAAREKPIGLFALGRAFGLSLMAILATQIPLSPLSIITPFATLALLALYLAMSELAAIPSFKKGSIR